MSASGKPRSEPARNTLDRHTAIGVRCVSARSLAVLGVLLPPAPFYPLAAGEGLFRFYAAIPVAALGAVLTLLGGALYGSATRRR